MRRTAVGGIAMLVLTALAGLPGGCASSEACGRGRYDPRDPRLRAQRGPYCLRIAAEGVGSVNVQVNPGLVPGGSGDDDGSGGALGAPSGGPFSYTQSGPGNVPWIEICNEPGARRTLVHVDDSYDTLPAPGAPPIPFPIRIYDVPATPPFAISSNGWVAFINSSGPLVGNIPDPSPPNLTVAPYWHDLYTRLTGVCSGVTGTAPNRAVVVEWQDLHFCCTDDPSVHLTFEVVVREARPPRQNNVIDVIYQRMDGANTRPTHAGIEDASGSAGVPINGPWTAPRTVRFTPSR